jgi:hypothetical protein
VTNISAVDDIFVVSEKKRSLAVVSKGEVKFLMRVAQFTPRNVVNIGVG